MHTRYANINTVCQISDVWCQLSDFRCLLSNVWFQVFDIRCLMSGSVIRRLTTDTWHQTSDIRHLKSDVWQQKSESRCLTNRHLKSDIWNQTSDIRHQSINQSSFIYNGITSLKMLFQWAIYITKSFRETILKNIYILRKSIL